MATAARLRANAKYQEKAYDKITIYLPKGTKERITAVSDLTVNAYAKAAVLDRLTADERKKDQPDESAEDFPFTFKLPDGITEENPFQ